MSVIDLVEQGHIPDILTRFGIRQLLRQRLRKETKKRRVEQSSASLIRAMADGPLAIHTDEANQQHYEVPTAFYDICLGQHKKYSCCFFKPHVYSLSTAEEDMLRLTCQRAELKDGMDILELGCGWGSLTLWMAKRYPESSITAVSNSATQKAYIEEMAARDHLNNIKVITCDMNDFETDEVFDRVVSVEMFEHMRNHELLFDRIKHWLKPEGKLFFHIFCHRGIPYFFEDEGESDWMARHFFSGGLMPSWDLPLEIHHDLTLENRWAVNGRHYARTCRAWLDQTDAHKEEALAIFKDGPDPSPAVVQLNRWRMFFMACEELFAYNQGNEWFVGHYLFSNKKTS